jgi:integrase/recombinase XerD
MGAVEGACVRCGKPSAGARYCSNCGLQLPSEPTTSEQPGEEHPPGAGEASAIAAPAVSEPATAEPEPAASVGDVGGREHEAPDLMAALSPPPPRPPRSSRSELAWNLLELARGPASLEHVQVPADAAAVFLRRYHGRPATQEAYARDLAHWFMWLRAAGIEPFEASLATIESYAREPLPGGHPPAPATVARRLACLSHFYRRALYAGLIERNPVDQAQRPKIPEQAATLGISKERARDLIRAARVVGPRETLLVLLMLELGLRVSEVVGADLEDLGEQGRHLVLAIKGKGQATKAALVPINPAVARAIKRARGARKYGPLLITSTGRRMTRQQAGRIIKSLGKEIGLPALHPHTLRHAFVTLSLDEGASLRDVQDAARHADPRTTRRYDRNRNSLERHPTHRLVVALEPSSDG